MSEITDKEKAAKKIDETIQWEKQGYDVPELSGKIKVPLLKKSASRKYLPQLFKNKEALKRLGYPVNGLVPDWKEKFLEKMQEILNKYRSVKLFMDICVRCGACTDKCHFYLGTGDPLNMPVARQGLMRKIYMQHFTPEGKLMSAVNSSEVLTEEMLVLWYTYFYQCSECRRCSVFCPYGIDTAEITMAAREILNSIGLVQKYTHEIIDKSQYIGNNLGMIPEALKNAVEFVESDLKEQTGKDIKIPVDVKDAEVLFVSPSADFFATPHIESLYGYAKVFHQAGISWTVSTYASEGSNFGSFVSNYNNMRIINKRIWDAAKELRVKRVVGGECGHMWRVLSSYSNTMWGKFDWLDQRYPIPQHICEFTLDLIKRKAIKIDKTMNDDLVVTYHDSCQIARGSEMGGTKNGPYEIPRQVIKACVNKFIEMSETTIKERTFCCGAGQGLLGDDMLPVRVKGSMPRMQSIKSVKDKYNVNFLALICAICKAQFTSIFPIYGYNMEEVGGVHQLVNRAIVLGEKEGL